MLKQLLTVEQVATILNMKKSAIYSDKFKQQVKHIKLGSNILRFREEDIEEYINSHVVEKA